MRHIHIYYLCILHSTLLLLCRPHMAQFIGKYEQNFLTTLRFKSLSVLALSIGLGRSVVMVHGGAKMNPLHGSGTDQKSHSTSRE